MKNWEERFPDALPIEWLDEMALYCSSSYHVNDKSGIEPIVKGM